MKDTQINGHPIKVSGLLGMVIVHERPSQAIFGDLVAMAAKTFNEPQDGTMEECYDKAVAWANAN